MTQGSFITDEIRKLIGVESEPSVYEVEKEPIRRWADAIGDPNPLYHDEEYAKKLGYRSIIAPPSFLDNYEYPIKVGKFIGFKRSATRNLNGGNEYEFFLPVQAGDVITRTTKYADIYERDGRLGKMLFVITEFTFRNQKGEMLGIGRHIGISY